MAKKILNTLLAVKMLKKLDLYAYSIQKHIYRTKCETKSKSLMKQNVCIFLIKEEKVFDKYNEIWGNVSNIIGKESNSKLVYNKKNLKAEKKSSYKACYAPVMLIDSVYRKDENLSS